MMVQPWWEEEGAPMDQVVQSYLRLVEGSQELQAVCETNPANYRGGLRSVARFLVHHGFLFHQDFSS